jgi:hypothetical protein
MVKILWGGAKKKGIWQHRNVCDDGQQLDWQRTWATQFCHGKIPVKNEWITSQKLAKKRESGTTTSN